MGSRFDLSVVTHSTQAIKYTLDYLNLRVTSLMKFILKTCKYLGQGKMMH